MGGFKDISKSHDKQKTLIVVLGPTAVGKTDMAVKLAQHYHTEIISADSRQFYREISIGTAKPSDNELVLAKHYFINSHSITDDFNVGDFEKQGLEILDKIFKEHNVAILVGGSGLYIKAICEGFDDLPSVDPEIRVKLNLEFAQNGILSLQERLQHADPDYYNEVDVHNPQRLIRALEVIESTGKPFSSYRTLNTKQRPFNMIKIGLNLPRAILYERINLRVDVMIAQGLLEEVKSLLPYRDLNALNTVGYKELFEFIDGKTSMDAAIAIIKQSTRHFAKRQLTWFNKDKETMWFEPTNHELIINYIERREKRFPKL
jgi:tRNA dimethylallyltransferase